MPTPDDQWQFLVFIQDKIAQVPEPKQRAVLAIVAIDAVYHGTAHKELARLLGMRPPAFCKLLGRGLITLGRLIREDDQLTDWLMENGFSQELIDQLLRGLFRPRG